jgi:NAD+ synthase (glutamine-hydrolysing)
MIRQREAASGTLLFPCYNDDMIHHGFVRVAAAVPALRVADCTFNVSRILGLMERAQKEQVAILVFPELAVTGYTCADLFHQTTLQRAAQDALTELAKAGQKVFTGLTVVGLPLVVDDQLFNCAAVFRDGLILGIVPKSFIPNYKEFYERRWFAPAGTTRAAHVTMGKQPTYFGTDLLFDNSLQNDGPVVGIEICEDLWVPIPPSSFQALNGADVLVNLSASNEIIGKAAYRRQLVLDQSGRCLAAYVYASSGVWESTTDVVFGGHCLIAENGALLAESQRLAQEETLLTADVDLERLRMERMRTNSFADEEGNLGLRREFRRMPFTLERPVAAQPLVREIDAHPFVPRGQEQLNQRCRDIFLIQVAGLAKRLEHIGKPPVYLGISGGLDSTLALLVTAKTFDQLGVSCSHIHGINMPGFGTTVRTRANARALMQHMGVSSREIDIRALCLEEMRALGHQPFGINLAGLSLDGLTAKLRDVPTDRRIDLVFENIQARMRTSILMNSGFVVGTGDLSELALGWCTYNADHASMYNPNASIPKTLVKFLVRWAADNEFDGEARRALHDVVATEISPELLPAGTDGLSLQSTEQTIGPFELHDFFLFHFLRYGAGPEKILFLAQHAAFDRPYTPEEVRRWLRVFLERFFTYQFKRSFLPDGPKVGTVSLSPRGDWRMPSDAQAAVWLEWLNQP